MAEDARWYIAEIVEEIVVEDDPRNVVHVNFVLLRANSSDDAYETAIELGRQSEQEYPNPAGKLVKCVFRGLRNLTYLYEAPEHGAEVWYEKKIGMSAEEIRSLTKPKDMLNVFLPDDNPNQASEPDYSAKDIMDEVERLMKGEGDGPDGR